MAAVHSPLPKLSIHVALPSFSRSLISDTATAQVGEAWTVPASKNRGLDVKSGYLNEIGQQPSAAALRVERQMYLDNKAYFRWTSWKARNGLIFGALVPLGVYMLITNELVRYQPPRRPGAAETTN